MQTKIKDFLKQKSFAVVGSFRNESKYAFQILKRLKEKGFMVYPVNPRLDQVDGLKCYKSVSDIPFLVDVVNIVTPPLVTEEIVRQCKDKGINRVWIQPGAESGKAISFCKNNNIQVIYQLCLMVEAI